MDGFPVTTVIVNYNTPELTERAVSSFRRFYSSVHILLIDNGSDEACVNELRRIRRISPYYTDLKTNPSNMHHGPAMDLALRSLQNPFVLFLDSDCEVLKGGFIEPMLSQLETAPLHYAIGKKIFLDKRGFDVPDENRGVPYIRPLCMMVKRKLYFLFPPFHRHGSPCLSNMMQAVKQGYQLLDYPVEEFIRHEGRGTAGPHGYQLGLAGRWNYFLHKLGL
ncbi:MAG TPA: glycosyltransferase [Bacteroidota bacterium]|nr:glycosyltransferase [Bacteroidota bacterium]